MTKSWVAGRGYAGVDDRIAENTATFGPRRFWLKPHSSQQVIFLDDDPIQFKEHQVCIDGSWQHWATCPDDGTCPLCDIGDKPRFVGVWTVIDRAEYKDKKGQVHKDEVRLFVATPKVIAKLQRRSDKLKNDKGKADGLVGLVFDVTRGDEKSPSTGDDFELVGKAKPELMAGKEVPSYEDLFKPDERKLHRYAKRLTGGSSRGGSSYDDDNDPF